MLDFPFPFPRIYNPVFSESIIRDTSLFNLLITCNQYFRVCTSFIMDDMKLTDKINIDIFFLNYYVSIVKRNCPKIKDMLNILCQIFSP